LLPVSVIICARNEAANLEKNLPAVLSQMYQSGNDMQLYEVIVVNDRSTDHTPLVLKRLQLKFHNLKVVDITKVPENKPAGKKYAQYCGVQAAAYDWLLLTDADCFPTSNQWISNMVQPLSTGKEIVAGYSGYYHLGGLLNSCIRWETLHTFLLYSSYIQSKFPYMAVGRNMACTKKLFMEAAETEKWNLLPYGDDDMLVAAAATEANTALVAVPQSFTISMPKTTWKTWMAQKQRHLSTGKYYKPALKMLIGEYALTHTLIWLSFFMLLIFRAQTAPVIHTDILLALMAVRCGLYYITWAGAAWRIDEKKLIPFFPFFDLGWMLYNFVFSPYIFLKNKKNWK